MIFYRKDHPENAVYEFEDKINFAVFPFLQDGPHDHQIGGLAVTTKQAATRGFKAYAKQVKANAVVLGKFLMGKWYSLVTDGTENPLVMWDLKPLGLTGTSPIHPSISEPKGTNDLALFVAKDECLLVNSHIRSIPESIRHLSFVENDLDDNSMSSKSVGVRTILFPKDGVGAKSEAFFTLVSRYQRGNCWENSLAVNRGFGRKKKRDKIKENPKSERGSVFLGTHKESLERPHCRRINTPLSISSHPKKTPTIIHSLSLQLPFTFNRKRELAKKEEEAIRDTKLTVANGAPRVVREGR